MQKADSPESAFCFYCFYDIKKECFAEHSFSNQYMLLFQKTVFNKAGHGF